MSGLKNKGSRQDSRRTKSRREKDQSPLGGKHRQGITDQRKEYHAPYYRR